MAANIAENQKVLALISRQLYQLESVLSLSRISRISEAEPRFPFQFKHRIHTVKHLCDNRKLNFVRKNQLLHFLHAQFPVL